MKIAYITRARMPTEKAHGLQIAKMCEAYALLGHDVELIVPFRKNAIQEDVHSYYGLKKEFVVRTIAIPDTIIFSRWVPSLAYWLQAFLFAFKLRKLSISKDTIIMTRSPDVAWWYGKKGYTVVTEVHDVPQTHHGLFKFFLKHAAHIVCNSEGTARKVRSLGFSHVHVAPNGVDIDALAPTRSKKEMREKLGIPQDVFVALYAGAFEAWKGYQTVLDAAALLTDVRVVMLGGKPEQVISLQEKYPHVTFLGTTPYKELGNYQSMADVLIIPNDPRFVADQENTSPIKLFAHLAGEVPIVVTDLKSIRDVVSEEEVFFFDGSVGGLVSAVHEVRHEHEEAEKRVGRASLSAERYTWLKRAETTLALVSKG